MADKYVKAFKIGEETYDVFSVNDDEQTTQIAALQAALEELNSSLTDFMQNYEAFVERIDNKIAELEAKINYEDEDTGDDTSSNND